MMSTELLFNEYTNQSFYGTSSCNHTDGHKDSHQDNGMDGYHHSDNHGDHHMDG